VKRDTIVTIAVATAVVLVLYVLFLFLPTARQLHARRLVLADSEREYAASQQLLGQYPEYKARAIRIQLTGRRLAARLPTEPRIPDLIKDITQAATESDIREFQFVPQPVVKKAGYAEQPVRMTLTCGYHALGEFLMRLATFPRLISARDIQLSGRDKTGRNESVAAELTLVTYVLPK
jgi:type IV pilus assembly protein PilO